MAVPSSVFGPLKLQSDKTNVELAQDWACLGLAETDGGGKLDALYLSVADGVAAGETLTLCLAWLGLTETDGDDKIDVLELAAVD